MESHIPAPWDVHCFCLPGTVCFMQRKRACVEHKQQRHNSVRQGAQNQQVAGRTRPKKGTGAKEPREQEV